MPEFEVEGRPVYYREAGEGEGGRSPVLLAHCSLAHSGMFKPIVADLSARRRVVALDMPAHGRTAPPPEGRSLQLYAADVAEALIDRIGEPVHLVGLSLGGATLGRVAARSPERARSLTMIEPVFFFLLEDGHRPEKAKEDALMARVHEAAARGDDMEAVRFFIEAWGAPGGFEALGAAGQEYAARVFPHLDRDFLMVHGHPPGQITPAEIAAIRPPAMLMWGAETQPSARAVVEEIAKLLPDARRREIPGAGHMSPVTHWREVLAELRDFFHAVEGEWPAD